MQIASTSSLGEVWNTMHFTCAFFCACACIIQWQLAIVWCTTAIHMSMGHYLTSCNDEHLEDFGWGLQTVT